MDLAEKTAWTTALRSGEYEQTTGVLRRPRPGGGYSHCCLGVKCELEPEGQWTEYGDYRVSFRPLGLGVGVLPATLADRLGITPDAQFLLPGGVQTDVSRPSSTLLALTTLNDNGFTFAEIADIIDYFF